MTHGDFPLSPEDLDRLGRLLEAARAEVRGGAIGRVLPEEFVQDGWMPANAEYMAELVTHGSTLIEQANQLRELWNWIGNHEYVASYPDLETCLDDQSLAKLKLKHPKWFDGSLDAMEWPTENDEELTEPADDLKGKK